MSITSFDIISKIRKLLNFGLNPRENSLKRRSEDQPDYSNSTKYRRVTSEFPKVIKKPFEDDSHFIQPMYMDGLTMAQKKVDADNSAFGLSGSRRKLFNPNLPNFAELEFSDDEDEIYSSVRGRNILAPSSFNSCSVKFRKPFGSQENAKPREINIPIRVERKQPPPLIQARTGGVLASSCIPNLQPIRKSKNAGILNPDYHTNGYTDHTNASKKFDALPSTRNDAKAKNAKSSNSVISKVFNLEEKEGYRHLLAQLVPSLYNTNGTNQSRRRSMRISDKRNISDNIDLTYRGKPKIENVINLDDDDEKPQQPKEVIELLDDDIQIISACQKLDNKKYTERTPKKQLPHVEPVNTLKDKLDLTPALQPNWLENFKERHGERARLRNQQIKEEEENVRKLGKETEEHERFIEQRLKNFMIDTETVILEDSEPEEEEVEFPELTEEDIAIVKKAIRGPAEEVLISKFNLQITRRDVSTLLGDSWLNDEVINFYMNLLIERGEQRCSEGLPKVYAMNTFFIPRLMQSGYAGVRRWTRKVDLLSCDIIPVPVHVGGVHWCMAIIHLKDRSIKYYDSMGTPNPKVLQALERYLQEESLDKKKESFDTSDFVKESVRDVPRQMNGSDCGVFSCMFAEYITRNKAITFSQQHMPYFRKKMILEIVQGKLLL